MMRGAQPVRSALDRHPGESRDPVTFLHIAAAPSPLRHAHRELGVGGWTCLGGRRSTASRRRFSAHAICFSATTALSPPNAKALESTARTLRWRATFGT